MLGWRIVASAFVGVLVSNSACAFMEGLPRPMHTWSQRCEANDVKEANAFSKSSRFAGMEPERQSVLLERLLYCARYRDDDEVALEVGRAALALRTPRASILALRVGLYSRDDALALAAFHDLASRAPARLKRSDLYLLGVIAAARRTDPTGIAELRVHDRLVALKYELRHDSEDALRVAHAHALVRRGQLDRARQRLGPVVNPYEILTLRVSRVFDPLRRDPEFERRLDVRVAAEANLVRARAEVAVRPRRLQRVRALARALRSLGRAQEALTALDRAIARASASGAKYRFDDIEFLPWLLNAKGSALYELGRTGEAHAALGSAITAEEPASRVNHVINFASGLEAEGKAAEAMALLRRAGWNLSPHGRMASASVTACAAEQLGDAKALAAAMAYLREHERDAIALRARALLCVNDIDEAAAVYVRRLRDPVEYADALLALQIYSESARRLPRVAIRAQRLALVRERPEVRAAIEAVGHIEQVPLP